MSIVKAFFMKGFDFVLFMHIRLHLVRQSFNPCCGICMTDNVMTANACVKVSNVKINNIFCLDLL